MEILITVVVLLLAGLLFFSLTIDFFASFAPVLDKLALMLGLSRKETTFEDNYLSKIATVTETISASTKGRVTLEGVSWAAIGEDRELKYKTGENVEVVGIDGNSLIVRIKHT